MTKKDLDVCRKAIEAILDYIEETDTDEAIEAELRPICQALQEAARILFIERHRKVVAQAEAACRHADATIAAIKKEGKKQ